MLVQKIDAPSSTTDAADLASARADAESLRKERDGARTDLAAQTKRADTLEAERDAARKEATDAKTASEQARADADANVEARVVLIDSARAVLGKDFVATGKTDKEIRLAVIAKVDPAFKADGRSDDYVTCRFDLACADVNKDRAALGDVNAATTTPAGTAPEKSRLDEALENQAKRRDEEARAGAPLTAQFKK